MDFHAVLLASDWHEARALATPWDWGWKRMKTLARMLQVKSEQARLLRATERAF